MIVRYVFISSVTLLIILMSCKSENRSFANEANRENGTQKINLPNPSTAGSISLEEALNRRRSVRNFIDYSMSTAELSQLLWAAQGITLKSQGFRTAPSAGATFPLELRAVIGNVRDVQSGVYRYNPERHSLTLISPKDKREETAEAALNQNWMSNASVIFIISAIPQRTTSRYGEQGSRFVHIESGHAAQNILLQAVTLGYGSTPVGAFREQQLRSIINPERNEIPLYIIPVGKAR